MGVLVMVGQLVLSLSILIVLHEMGHFFPAKWFKTRVEKFYLFFDPWFSLVKKKVGETEYGIGWLPLGGYVKISGMIDESFDSEQMKEEPKPWEFRSKPAWQRLIIMLGGVTVNFILGFFIFAMILWNYGEEFLPTKNLANGIAPDSIGLVMGLQKGDHVLAVGKLKMEQFNPNLVRTEVIINDARTIEIERNGQPMTLTISEELAESLQKYENKNFSLYSPRVPFVAGGFAEKCKGILMWKKCEESPAQKGGMKKEDKILALNGQPTPFFDEFYDKIKALPAGAKEVAVTVERKDTVANTTDTLVLNIMTNAEGLIGAGPYEARYFFKTERKEYTLGQALPGGISKGVNFLGNQIKAFGRMFTGKIKASESLGSFITIGSMFGSVWNWERFWQMTALLSLVLGFINLLPIPALDGGHVMFLLWEVLTGKKPSDKVMEYSTMAGFVILIGIMVYSLGLDISRLF